jgi:LmbE family N-acetylglucosaminyl deacetylase
MTNHLCVIAVHPDDETYGCGGLLLKRKNAGLESSVIFITGMKDIYGYSANDCVRRAREIAEIRQIFGLKHAIELEFEPAGLDTVSRKELVVAIKKAIQDINPSDVIIPFLYDVHSDHGVVAQAALSVLKRFRLPSVRRVMAMETLSETEQGSVSIERAFVPNLFMDMSQWLEEKIKAAQIYASEFGEHPFPRSAEGIRALARYRGLQSGVAAAEAFVLVRSVEIE